MVELLTDQYFNLNKIHDKTKESIAAIKSLQLSDEEKNTRIKKEEEEKTHSTFKTAQRIYRKAPKKFNRRTN